MYYHAGNPRYLNTKRAKHFVYPVPPHSTYSRRAGRRHDGHDQTRRASKDTVESTRTPVQEVVNHLLNTPSQTPELAVRQTDVQWTRVHHTNMPHETIYCVMVSVITHDGTATVTSARQRSATDEDKEEND